MIVFDCFPKTACTATRTLHAAVRRILTNVCNYEIRKVLVIESTLANRISAIVQKRFIGFVQIMYLTFIPTESISIISLVSV